MTQTTGKKRAAQKAWGLQESLEIPMVIVPKPDQELVEIFSQILDAIVAVGLQLVLVDTDSSLSDRLKELKQRHPEAVAVVSQEDSSATAGDVEVLHAVDAEAKKRYEESPRVPVAEDGVELFDPIAEKGFGFNYDGQNPWTLLVALVRASETFRFPYDWKNLLRAVKKMANQEA